MGLMTGKRGLIMGLANDKSLIPGGFPSQAEYLLDLAQTIADGTKGEIPDYSFTAPVLVE